MTTLSSGMTTAALTDPLEEMSLRTLAKHAKSLGLPGKLKKKEYVQLLRLCRMGLDAECRTLASEMKTKKQKMKKCVPKEQMVKKRSVGRPRKSKVQSDEPSENILLHTDVASKVPAVETVHVRHPMYSPSALENTDAQPPIAKTTSQLLRNVLLSSDRMKFNRPTSFTPKINPYFNYYQYDGSKPLNLEVSDKTSTSPVKWKNKSKNSSAVSKPINELKYTASSNSLPPDIQAFPDIPQLADVDINASFEIDNSNNSLNDRSDDSEGGLCIDDSDTLSNQSAENLEQEQRDFDQRWAMSIRMENGDLGTSLVNCETFNSLDDGSLLGPHDTASVQNDVIQNYIETNDVQFMQLPDSSCEVIRTLQYYESRFMTSRSFTEHIGNDEQLNSTGTNHTLVECANILPCPIAGCVWYSHSATLYVHLLTCHQQMIYYGNSFTHLFKCQDIHTSNVSAHLQYVQNTIYIITVALFGYSNSFVATIQHVSSYGDNTSISSTTAILTNGSSYNNNYDQHSWTGPVQPYSVPLNVLHADGRCLFIKSNNSEHLIINVNLTETSNYSGDSKFTCL